MKIAVKEQVHVWSLPVKRSPFEYEALLTFLSKDECIRAEKLRDPECFVLARAGLRCLLSEYLACKPQDIQFAYNEFGKPSLAENTFHQALYFNLSHTNEMIVWAFSQAKLGVDIEKVSPQRGILDIAKRFFTAEEVAQIQEQPQAEQAVFAFQLWCYKEAFLKATGQGIVAGLDSFSILLKGGQVELLDADGFVDPEQNWNILALEVNEFNHLSALAISGVSPVLQYSDEKTLLSLIEKKMGR